MELAMKFPREVRVQKLNNETLIQRKFDLADDVEYDWKFATTFFLVQVFIF